jgi:ribulose kinase
MGVISAAPAELAAGALVPELLGELLELLELQAAISVAAATAATAVMVAREAPTPRRLRNVMGTSRCALSESAARTCAAA